FYCPAEIQGGTWACTSCPSGSWSCGGHAIAGSQAFTVYKGRRKDISTDITLFGTNKFGANTWVKDPFGNWNTFGYGDWEFPVVVTQHEAPNGFLTQSYLNSRGLPDSTK